MFTKTLCTACLVLHQLSINVLTVAALHSTSPSIWRGAVVQLYTVQVAAHIVFRDMLHARVRRSIFLSALCD